MRQEIIIEEILKERKRQNELHPNNKLDNYLEVLIEEVGEVAMALQGEGNLEDELIQVASVCMRWIEELN